MSLGKSECWCKNNCLHFLKHVVPFNNDLLELEPLALCTEWPVTCHGCVSLKWQVELVLKRAIMIFKEAEPSKEDLKKHRIQSFMKCVLNVYVQNC
jgi:hypothetical protein